MQVYFPIKMNAGYIFSLTNNDWYSETAVTVRAIAIKTGNDTGSFNWNSTEYCYFTKPTITNVTTSGNTYYTFLDTPQNYYLLVLGI